MENLKKNLQMFDFKENQPVVITTCYSEDFGYSYNDEILKYLRMDEKNIYFIVTENTIDFEDLKELYKPKDKVIGIKKEYIKTIEDASNFINDINSIENYEQLERIKISASNLTRDKSFLNIHPYLVAENKTHFQFLVKRQTVGFDKYFLVISRKDDRDITYVGIRLVEYKKGDINPFITYPKLADIWTERKERAISSINRFNQNESTGRIFLVLLENEVIGITGYYLIDADEKHDIYEYSDNDINDIDSYVGLRWHGIVLEHQKRGYSQKALDLLIDEVKNDTPARYIQELLPFDKLDNLPYFEKMGFINKDLNTPKIYKEMPDIKCYRLVKELDLNDGLYLGSCINLTEHTDLFAKKRS